MQRVVVSQINDEALGIRSYELIDPEGAPLAPFAAGAHIDLHLGDEMVRSYSLCNDPRERHRYLITVLHEPIGRGGSIFVHKNLAVGGSVLVSEPKNNFPLVDRVTHYTLIAGGIGITPLLSMARFLESTGGSYTLYYCARNPKAAPFCSLLAAPPFNRRTKMHFSFGDPGQRLDIKSILRQQMEGQHVYCCGPASLIETVKLATQTWSADAVHFERFKVDPKSVLNPAPNSSFEIEIASTGRVLIVPHDKSILQVLRESGISRASSCEEGVCGTCETGLLGGRAEHRDSILTEREKTAHNVLMTCCSRAATKRLKLDV